MPVPSKKLTHIDLFSGVGGVCTGFKAAGIETLAAVEYVDSCAETYEANHPSVKVFNTDIREVTDSQIKSYLASQGLDSIDIVTAGFPCETFSTAGSKSRVYDDHRNYLYKEGIRIAKAANARVLMLENVAAFLSKKDSKTSDIKILDLLIQDLISAGYVHYDFDVLNAADFGVPQNRQRFILIATKDIPIQKEFFNSPTEIKRAFVGDALSDLPLIDQNTESNQYASAPQNTYQEILRDRSFWSADGDSVKELTYHVAPKHRPKTVKRFELISPGEGLKDLFFKFTKKKVASLQEKGVLPKKWYIQRNQRLISDNHSPTVTSHCLDELVHPTLHRGLSVREAARLQSFPDWYDFKGGPFICPHMYKTQDKYEQIGDAVPPLLSKHLGESIIRILENANETNFGGNSEYLRAVLPSKDGRTRTSKSRSAVGAK